MLISYSTFAKAHTNGGEGSRIVSILGRFNLPEAYT